MKPSVASPVWTWGVLILSLAFIGSSISLVISANQQEEEISASVNVLAKLSDLERSMRDLERKFSNPDLLGAVDFSDARRRILSSFGTPAQSKLVSGRPGRSYSGIDSLVTHMDLLYAGAIMSGARGDGSAGLEPADFQASLGLALDDVTRRTRDAHNHLADLSVVLSTTWRTITALIVILSLLGIFAAVLHSMHYSAGILNRSETHFKALFRNSTDIIIVIQTDGTIKYASPSLERLLDARLEDIVGEIMYEYIHPGDVASVHASLIDCFSRPGSTKKIEYRQRGAGTWVTVEAIVSNQLQDDQIRGVVICARDITDRKGVEEALHVRDRAMDAAGNGIFITDPLREGNPIVYCNPAFQRMTGYDNDEVVGQGGLSTNDLYADASVSPHIERAYAEEREAHIVSRAYRKCGEPYWIELTISPVTDSDRNVTHFVGVQSDISARKKAEEERKRFVSLVENSSDFVAMTDLDGRVFYLNPAGRNMVGISPDGDLDTMKIDDFVPDCAREQFRAKVIPAIFDEGSWVGEGRLINSGSGAEVDVAMNLFLVHHPETSEPMCIAAVNRDIAERKRAMAELLEAKDNAEEMAALKSTFLANMSHEIRTPLTGILGFASVLREDISPEHVEFVDLIERSGRRLLDTLNTVLDLARLEAEAFKLQATKVDLIEKTRTVVHEFATAASEKGITIGFSSTATSIPAIVDSLCLHRIVSNLLSNAVKFTEQGRVDISVEAVGQDARITVEDTGIGISSQFLPYLFEEFKQESSGMSRTHEGSGLGLSVTKRLVELLDGSISVSSRKGAGSVFSVRFPRNVKSTDHVRVTSHEQEPAESGSDEFVDRPRVLAVIPNVDTQILIRHMLRRRCDVQVASSETEAREMMHAQQYSVVLFDIDSDEQFTDDPLVMDLDLVASGIPVLALTAHVSSGDGLVDRYLEQGFTGVVGKPLLRDELLQAVRQVVPG